MLDELLTSEAQAPYPTDHSGPVLGQQEPHTHAVLVDPLLSPLDSDVPSVGVETLLCENRAFPAHSGFKEKADT